MNSTDNHSLFDDLKKRGLEHFVDEHEVRRAETIAFAINSVSTWLANVFTAIAAKVTARENANVPHAGGAL